MRSNLTLTTNIKLVLQATLGYRDRVLIVLPMGGLANRLRVLASAKLMAEVTRRKFLVRWWPTPKKCNAAWSDLFVNTLNQYPPRLLKYRERFQPDQVKWLIPFRQPEVIPELENIFRSDIPIVVIKYFGLFKPQELAEPDFDSFRSQFYRSLIPIPLIRDAVANILTQQFANHEVIGVHIRRTDLGQILKASPQEVSPTTAFIEAMEKVLAGNPKEKFFLATDHLNEEQMFKAHFLDKLIVFGKSEVNRDTTRGIQEALIDWLLLSKTSMIIRSHRSSFSAESAVVNQIPILTIGNDESVALYTKQN